VTIGLCICGFLLVVLCNHASILHRYGNLKSQKYWVTTLAFWGHMTSSITWQSDSAWALFYWWSMMTMRLFWGHGASKILGSRVWSFGITWRHRSRDRWTRHMWFPIGGLLEPCNYILARYGYMGLQRYWPFGVTWRHRSRGRWTRHMWFSIGGPL